MLYCAERDTDSEPCQRFFRDGLTLSFNRILTDEAVSSWKPDIQVWYDALGGLLMIEWKGCLMYSICSNMSMDEFSNVVNFGICSVIFITTLACLWSCVCLSWTRTGLCCWNYWQVCSIQIPSESQGGVATHTCVRHVLWVPTYCEMLIQFMSNL